MLLEKIERVCSYTCPIATTSVWTCRRLTDRQRALMMSYAEDEADVDGTVNGVTNTASGEWWELALPPDGAGFLGRRVSQKHLETAWQHNLPAVEVVAVSG